MHTLLNTEEESDMKILRSYAVDQKKSWSMKPPTPKE